MTHVLFYDAETCGVPDFKAPSDAEHQPHIVQLAALLVDKETRKTIASMDTIIRPAGWTIPDDVVAVHGITTEHALAVGIPERLAIQITPIFGRELEGAHSAMADAQACRDIYFAMLDQQTEPA